MAGTLFANPGLHVQSWYVACPSRRVRGKKLISVPYLDRRLVLFRRDDGTVAAFNARCPHLGADLGEGKIVDGKLRCAFHHWRFEIDGTGTSGLRLEPYPVCERWGLIFVFNGPKPLFPLPGPEDGKKYWSLRFPSGVVNAHPHVVTVNGHDIAHFQPLHDFVVTKKAEMAVHSPHSMSTTTHGYPRSGWRRVLAGIDKDGLSGTFTSFGGNISWTTLRLGGDFRAYLLLINRPGPRPNTTETHAVLLSPRGAIRRFLHLLYLVVDLSIDDSRILKSIQFQVGNTPSDAPLLEFIQLVNRMPHYSPQ